MTWFFNPSHTKIKCSNVLYIVYISELTVQTFGEKNFQNLICGVEEIYLIFIIIILSLINITCYIFFIYDQILLLELLKSQYFDLNYGF